MPYIDAEVLAKLASVEREPVVGHISEGEEKAFAKIQRLSCVRERCQSELRLRLEREGFSLEEVNHAIERAVACGLVDDMRYAGVLIRSRLAQGKGRQGIEAELSRAGIDVFLIPGWPEEFFSLEENSEFERALNLLRRNPPRAKNMRAAAFRRLVSKGYDQQVAFEASQRFYEETL